MLHKVMFNELVIERVSTLLAGRPVRWATNGVGDYDGRDRTLEVFNADAEEQRELFGKLFSVRDKIEGMTGGPVIVIFHTRAESVRLYSDFLKGWDESKSKRDESK